jgi:hypothetical protein
VDIGVPLGGHFEVPAQRDHGFLLPPSFCRR